MNFNLIVSVIYIITKVPKTNAIDPKWLQFPNKTSIGCGLANSNNLDDYMVVLFKKNPMQAPHVIYPWTVYIDFACDGSLITPQVVLTAAVCAQYLLANASARNVVKAGKYGFSQIYKQVVDVVIHERFNKKRSKNNIALLFLESPYDLGVNIDTICLPPPGYNFVDSKCFTGSGPYQDVLDVVENNRCQEVLRNASLRQNFQLHSSFMCAFRVDDRLSGLASVGSPLRCHAKNSTNYFYQAGIVSRAARRKRNGDHIPGLYTNVSKFREWIDRELTKKQIGSSTYTPEPVK